jgi:hypothetical protein
MLVGLLDVSAKYPEQIYAWEVMNEPLWLCLAAFRPLSPSWWFDPVPEVTFEQMSDFLEEGFARINNYKVPRRFGPVSHRLAATIPLLRQACAGERDIFRVIQNGPSSDTWTASI